MALTPRPYQLQGRDFLASKHIGLLADEMRVGKTPQAILACEKVGAKRVLVICPAIAVPMWRFQFPRWWAGIDALVDVYSFEKALIYQNQITDTRYDVVIVDECHFAGNPEAKRTKMIYGKEGLAHRCKHLWALSGTPAPKHAGSLWPLLRTAGVVNVDYATFIRRYCRIDFMSQRPVGTKEEHIPELRALWQQIGLRRTKKQVAPDMADIEFDFLQIEPSSKVDLSATTALEIEAGREVAIDSEIRSEVAMAKVGPLLAEVEFALANGLLKQTVIFGWHLEPLRKIVSCLKAMDFKAVLLAGETSSPERVQIQEQFARGAIDVIVGQIRACGTAIDLSAASHAYFLELDWTPASNLQAANRLVAIGKEEKVTVDVVTWPGSIDDRVQRVLLRRARELNALI